MLGHPLRPRETSALAASRTATSEAYPQYLRGRGHLENAELLTAGARAEALETALGFFARALEADSSYALAHAGAGEANWRLRGLGHRGRRIAAGIAHCERALEIDPNLPEALLSLAAIRLEQGNAAAAADLYTRVLTLRPLDVTALSGLAAAYAAQQKHGLAEAVFRRAEELYPEDWRPFREHGLDAESIARSIREWLPARKRAVNA